MKKSYHEQLLNILEKDIFDSERKVRDEQTKLERLKEERISILKELADDELNGLDSSVIFIKGVDDFDF